MAVGHNVFSRYALVSRQVVRFVYASETVDVTCMR